VTIPNNRVLILDADSSAGLAATQSLGRVGREVHSAVRMAGSAIEATRWCRKVHLQPPNLPIEMAVDWLLELDRKFEYSLIIPSTEASLLWLRYLPEHHDTRRKAIIPGNASIDIALDKSLTYQIAVELGLPVPASRLITKESLPAPPESFPVVLKPVRSKVSIGERLCSMAVAIAHDEKERALILRNILPHTDVQEQSWVEGRGGGVEVLYNRGKMIWHFIHQRLHEWPLTGGASTLRIASPDNPELVERSRHLLNALNWHGVAMVEWRCSSDGRYYLVEINPRLWGSLPLTIAAGVNIPEGLFALSQGHEPASMKTWKIGLSARVLSRDFFWCVANARADRADHLLLTEPVLRSALGWFRVLSTKEVWDGWSIYDPKVAVHELSLLFRKITEIFRGRFRASWLSWRARNRYMRLVREIRKGERVITNVLFVCYGNICRSPFAATVARSRWQSTTSIASVGFHQTAGRPPPLHVVDAAQSLGFDLLGWKSTKVTPAHVAAADLIIVMDIANLDSLIKMFPHASPRTIILGVCDPSSSFVEVRDPYDLSPAATEQVLKKILRAIDCLSRDLKL
jgi:protein-tyrosine-phosphatase/predicted ATP-grasp superfamily ATP-dependent carboligase